MAQRLKCLPGMQEARVRSLDREDPLEKEMATHSSILAWEIPWREEPDKLQCMGHKESDMTEVTQHAHRCMYAFMYAYSFIHFFCSYVLHLEAGMSVISHSSLSLAVRSYLLDFSLGFLKEPRRSNYLTGGPLQ